MRKGQRLAAKGGYAEQARKKGSEIIRITYIKRRQGPDASVSYLNLTEKRGEKKRSVVNGNETNHGWLMKGMERRLTTSPPPD